MKLFNTLIIFFFTITSLVECALPADITFLIVDFKYTKEQGVKICEVQTANVSSFAQYDLVYEEKNLIYKEFCKFINYFQTNTWTSIADLSINEFIEECSNTKWHILNATNEIFKTKAFLKAATKSVQNPHDLRAYHGAIYCRSHRLNPIDQLQKIYPGILVIDASIFPYQNDKLKISKLFDSDPSLAQYRPKWNAYPKRYSKALSQRIAKDFQHSRVVIKPHKSTLGRGVIIVDAKDLDKTLKLIFKNQKKLKKKRDPSYTQWLHDKDDTFLVEEFAHSDPIHVSHLDDKAFDPTYRTTFLLYYHNEEVNIEFIEHLSKLPEKSLDSKGTLNEKHKTILKQPYYTKVSDTQRTEFEAALTFPLLKMYQLMLNLK